MAFREDPDGYWADCWSLRAECCSRSPAASRRSASPGTRRTTGPCSSTTSCPAATTATARLADMDRNHTDASLCFPTFPRFCGQTFLERGDRDLALACVQAYNDWMIGEWCADEARGRLIPLTLIPMWDPDLAAQEVRRCAAKGSHAIAFSENPAALGPAQRAHRRLGSAVGRVRGDRHRGQHAHRLVLHLQQDQRRRAAAGDHRAHLRGRVARPGGLADQRRAGPVLLAAHRLVRGSGGLDAVPAGTARRGLGPRPRLRQDPAEGAGAAQQLRAGPGLRLRLRRPGGPRAAGPHRHEPDHVRDRLPARRLHLPALQGHRRQDHHGRRPLRT